MSVQVWSRFEAKRSDGTLVKLLVQDLTENRHDEAVEFLIKHFVLEEIFNKASGVPQNPKAIEESRKIITESLNDPSFHSMICCHCKDDDEIAEIVGVSVMQLIVAESEPFQDIKLETIETQKVIFMLQAINDMYNPMKELKISRYCDDRGLAVHPGFRKLGIATELFKARRLACEAHNVPATGALMTSIGSKKAAKKDNWETVLEVNLEKLGQQHDVIFDDSTAELMIWRSSLSCSASESGAPCAT